MELKLDQKDKKILEQLDINSRQSNSQIAKRVRISKDAVGYRIKNLEKSKIVSGYYSVLNIAKLGYITYKLMLTFQNTTSKIEKEIIEYLKQKKNVGWLVSCDGYYNLMVVTWVKNSAIFDNFLKEFLKRYSQFIKERDIILITENHSHRKEYLHDNSKEITKDIFYGFEQTLEIDKIDLFLIRQLSENSRISLNSLSESVKLTPEAIAHRIKKLKKQEIIQAFRPIINTSLLGYQYYNILFKLKKFDNVDKIFNFFRQQPNIIYFVKYLGNYDIGIDLEVKSLDELRTILNQIKDTFSEDIQSYNSILINQEHKLSYFPE